MSCAVCEHVRRAEIDAALRAGRTGYKALARCFGVTREDILEHKRTCLRAAPAIGPVRLLPAYGGPVCAPARAEHAPDPCAALDFDARVAFVLGEMARGDFDAPRDVVRLAAAWNLSADHTRRIVKAAGAAYRASTSDLDSLRAASQGRWMHLYRAALDADDIRAAAVAAAGHDRITGLESSSKARQVPLTEDPAFQGAAEMYVNATLDALNVDRLTAALPEIPREHVARVVALACDDLDRRLREIEEGSVSIEHA